MADICTHGFDTGFVTLGYAKVAVLGVVQGITELLPLLSTAHMRVMSALLGWQDPGSGFSAAMQLGALAAVVSYFWSDVRELTANSLRAVARWQFDDRHLRFSIWIAFGTIPIGVAGLALAGTLNASNSPLRSISVVGWACVVMAILLGVAEVCARHKRTIDDVSFADAAIVGIAQVGALIPGVSRSGSTLTAASHWALRETKRLDSHFFLDCRPLPWPGSRSCGSFGTLNSNRMGRPSSLSAWCSPLSRHLSPSGA